MNLYGFFFHPLVRLISGSILQGVLSVLGIIALVIILLKVSPADPTSGMGANSVERRQQIAEQLGIDQPVYVMFWRWIERAARGDLGTPYSESNTTVVKMLRLRALPTVYLLLLTYFIIIAIAIPLGIYLGLPRKAKLNNLLNSCLDFLGALPDFWLASVLALIFALNLRWLPRSSNNAALSINVMIMPALALIFGSGRLAVFVRYTREEISMVLSNKFIELAFAKGIGRFKVLWRHALPNAIIPIFSYGIGSVPVFIGATIVVESIFTYPGLGLLIYKASKDSDYPMIIGATLILALLVSLLNLFQRLFIYAVDPRVRES